MNQIESLEYKIATFLRAGVIVAGTLMLTGWLIQFKLHGNPFFNFETYDHIPLADLLKIHLHHKSWGVLISYVGMVTLISLPIIRVVLTAILFIRQKEYVLAMIAFAVLAGLILSMTLGIEL